MPTYRRRLPHWHSAGQTLFITWRLHESLPRHRPFPDSSRTSGKAFVTLDRLLEECRSGPLHLSRLGIAQVVVEALEYGQNTLGYYTLHAFVVMPNHVHVLLTPHVAVPKLLGLLKSFTARRANQILGSTGRPFWQDESYDHLVRNKEEWQRIRRYIEQNPVRAKLASSAGQYRWSSTWKKEEAGLEAGCGPGGPPHNAA